MKRQSKDAGVMYAIGIDIGTSAVKVAVLANDGTSEEYASAGYPVEVPEPGYAEQNPDHWWEDLGRVLSSALDAHPGIGVANVTVALTGQMHTTVYRDSQWRLLRPAILWSDSRSKMEASDLLAAFPEWDAITGNTLMPAFSASHIEWVKRNQPGVFEEIRAIAVPKDDVRRRLGAGFFSELSDASGMALLDTRSGDWSPELLTAVGIDSRVLPELRQSSDVTGIVRELPESFSSDKDRILGAPVIGGAGDQAALAIALGAVRPGSIAISVGTSGAVMQTSDRFAEKSFRHALRNSWLTLDSMHTAGMAMKWWSDIAPDRFVEFELQDLFGSSSHPVFLPYLQGERGAGDQMGAFANLGLRDDANSMSLAVLEGIGLELVRLVQDLCSDDSVPQIIRIGGRAGRMPLIREVVATGLNRQVEYCDRSSAFGAAALAAESAGWIEDFWRQYPQTDSKTEPNLESLEFVSGRLERYRALRTRMIDMDQSFEDSNKARV